MRGPIRWAKTRGQNLHRLRGAAHSESRRGPLTLGRFATSSSPRAAGEVRTWQIVLATHVRPSFAGTTRKKPELDPVMRRRWWIPAAISITFSQIKQDGGTPKDAYSFRPHPSGCGRDLSAGRSPVGVPPRHLRQRTNATAQLQKRSSWDAAKKRALPAPACPSPAAWPQTGHSAGRTSSRSRPGAKVTSPGSREPLSLRQPA